MLLRPDVAFPVRMALLVMLLTLSAPGLFADSVNTKERTVTKIAEGIYVIRHPDAPDDFPQGNTTVIIGEREVMVIDSCYLPSTAREDIAQIRQWTNKPVRYLVNTHWHGDHSLGNSTYAEAFPALSIIARVETRDQINGFSASYIGRYPTFIAKARKALESGKEADGTPLTDKRRTELAKEIEGREKVQAEFRNMVVMAPNVTFDRELDVSLGGRDVQLKFLGLGNTKGDVVVYLPKEKILITGDLLDHPVPYLGGGFPFELVSTLREMALLYAETIVPGHGDVLKGEEGRAYIKLVADFVETVSDEVRKETYRLGNGSGNLEAVQKAVLNNIDMNAWRQKFAGDDKDNREFFDTFSMPGLIKAAYRESWGI